MQISTSRCGINQNEKVKGHVCVCVCVCVCVGLGGRRKENDFEPPKSQVRPTHESVKW